MASLTDSNFELSLFVTDHSDPCTTFLTSYKLPTENKCIALLSSQYFMFPKATALTEIGWG